MKIRHNHSSQRGTVAVEYAFQLALLALMLLPAFERLVWGPPPTPLCPDRVAGLAFVFEQAANVVEAGPGSLTTIVPGDCEAD